MDIYLPEVKSMSGEAVAYSFQHDLSDCFADFKENGNLKISVEACHSGDKIIIRGKLQTSIEAFCSRCLEPFVNHFETAFTDSFTLLKGSTAEDDPVSQALETANMLTVSGDYLYLDEYVRQLFILAQEYNPLCNPDCKGICAGCGVDLNRSNCRCGSANNSNSIDMRLLKLRELRSGS
jgi:uncharacterized protein